MRAPATLFLLLGLTTAVAAQPAPPTSREIARQAVQRTRRAYAVGPTVGGAVAVALDGGGADGAITFGLALRGFDVGLPPADRLRALVEERVRARVAEHVRERVARGAPELTERELRAYARQIIAEVRDELVAELFAPPRLLDRPRFAADLEVVRLFDSAAWQLRAGAGIGLGPVTLGPTLAVLFGGDVGLALGAELAVHLLPGDGPRSPVIDLTLRGDFAVISRDDHPDVLSLGARLLVDIL